MAVTSTRDTPRQGNESLANVVAYQQAASTTIYGGTIVVINAAGYAEPATAASAKLAVGVAIKDSVEATGVNGGATVEVRRGQFPFDNASGDPVVQADVAALCYITDNCTVNHTATGKSAAGKVIGIAASGQVIVDVNSIIS